MRPHPRSYMCGSAARDEQERRLEHDPEDQREAVRRELLDRRDVLDARVVDQDVRLEPEVGERLGEAEVEDPGLAGDLLGDRLGPGGVAVAHHDLRARFGEMAGHGRAYPARTAGDDGTSDR